MNLDKVKAMTSHNLFKLRDLLAKDPNSFVIKRAGNLLHNQYVKMHEDKFNMKTTMLGADMMVECCASWRLIWDEFDGVMMEGEEITVLPDSSNNESILKELANPYLYLQELLTESIYYATSNETKELKEGYPLESKLFTWT